MSARPLPVSDWQPIALELLEALRPFVDIGHQKGAWGAISKKLDGLAPLTVTVTKAQMLAAFAAISKATPQRATTSGES